MAGLPTPANDAMAVLFRRLERGDLTQRLDNLELLRDTTAAPA